jgi:hypothetical protein
LTARHAGAESYRPFVSDCGTVTDVLVTAVLWLSV